MKGLDFAVWVSGTHPQAGSLPRALPGALHPARLGQQHLLR